MAATETSKGQVAWEPLRIQCVELSTMEPGVVVNVEHYGPSGMSPLYVTHEVSTRPTSRDPVDVSHIRASDSTTNDTCAIVVDTSDQGDLTGAVVRLYFHFLENAYGGIS